MCIQRLYSLSSDRSTDKRLLVLDLLAVHLVRNVKENTIISYHPTNNKRTTQAKFLHERIRFAGMFRLVSIFRCVYSSRNRTICLLAEYLPKLGRSDVPPSCFHLARHLCLGSSFGGSLWAYKLSGVLLFFFQTKKWCLDSDLTLLGNPCNDDNRNAPYP